MKRWTACSGAVVGEHDRTDGVGIGDGRVCRAIAGGAGRRWSRTGRGGVSGWDVADKRIGERELDRGVLDN